MSLRNFRKAMRLIKRCEDYEIGEGVSKSFIEYAEKQLEVEFSPIHKYYLRKYGDLCFCGYEVFGLAENVPEDAPAWGNLLSYTLLERKENRLPHEWFPILSLDDGEMVYLDYSDRKKDEPKAIVSVYNGTAYIKNQDDTFMDLGDYILYLAQQCV